MGRRKIYIIEIEDCTGSPLNLWYKNLTGKRFHASLGIAENGAREKVPAFILNEPPFFRCCRFIAGLLRRRYMRVTTRLRNWKN